MKLTWIVAAVAAIAVSSTASMAASPRPHTAPPPNATTFDNVAASSLHVTTKTGKRYDPRNIGGNTAACEPPRKLVRSDVCWPIPNGGIRCKFDCQ